MLVLLSAVALASWTDLLAPIPASGGGENAADGYRWLAETRKVPLQWIHLLRDSEAVDHKMR